jgi:hypothetical protein
MAHHIFRRCLLVDVVPPVPPPVVVYGDYRLVVGSPLFCAYDTTGTEFGTSVAGLDVMSRFFIPPIPPGMDTGLGYGRLDIAAGLNAVLPIRGVSIHGGTAAGGVYI